MRLTATCKGNSEPMGRMPDYDPTENGREQPEPRLPSPAFPWVVAV